jgi:hypothetical protein
MSLRVTHRGTRARAPKCSPSPPRFTTLLRPLLPLSPPPPPNLPGQHHTRALKQRPIRPSLGAEQAAARRSRQRNARRQRINSNSTGSTTQPPALAELLAVSGAQRAARAEHPCCSGRRLRQNPSVLGTLMPRCRAAVCAWWARGCRCHSLSLTMPEAGPAAGGHGRRGASLSAAAQFRTLFRSQTSGSRRAGKR